MTSYYGFTIKYIKANDTTSIEKLESIMRALILRHKATYVDHFIEYDSIKRAHIHGTFMARKGLLLNLFKYPYFHIHLDYLKSTSDVQNWAHYIRKDQDGFESFLKDIREGDYRFNNI